jgi:RES domain-containing protein
LIDGAHLADIFKTLGQPFRGSFFRSVPLRFVATPLSAVGSQRTGGRYNPPGSFEVLYAANSADTVLRETRAVVVDPATGRPISLPLPPAVHMTINVDLQSVVDLTIVENCDVLGLHPDDLVNEWRALLAESKVPPTHQVGAAAREADVEALLVPSARLSGTKNIAIIIDRLRIGSFFEIYRPEGFAPGTAIRVEGQYHPKC